jgi:hypothetical protein
MTHALAHAHWSETPSAPQLWLGTMLRALAMLVLYAASIFRMRLSLFSGECHAEVEPETLPEGKSGIIKETDKAVTHSHKPTTIPSMSATTTIFDASSEDGDFDRLARTTIPSAPHWTTTIPFVRLRIGLCLTSRACN